MGNRTNEKGQNKKECRGHQECRIVKVVADPRVRHYLLNSSTAQHKSRVSKMRSHGFILTGLVVSIVVYFVSIGFDLDLFEMLVDFMEKTEEYEFDELIIPGVIVVIFILLTVNNKLKAEIVERCRTEDALSEAKEKADAANTAKSRFLANMSHEITVSWA